MNQLARAAALLTATLVVGCATAPEGAPPLPRADTVDLDRFAGDWYVIAHVPLPPEREAYNAVERYRHCDDGRMETVFRFRDGGFDGDLEIKRPTGYPDPEGTGAEWGMSFIWPFRAEFIVSWVDADYESTIIARTRRDYAWLMHRAPAMTDAQLADGIGRMVAMGYAEDDIRIVPQAWPESRGGLAAPSEQSAPVCD